MPNPIQRLLGSEDTWDEIVGILLLVAALLFLGSLVTFDPADVSWIAFPHNFPAHNFAGAFGAGFAGLFLFLFGFAAYWVPILVLIWAIGRFWQASFWRSVVRLYGSAILIFATATLFSIAAWVGSREIQMDAGGIVGLFLSEMLHRYFGKGGALLITGTLGGLALVLSTDLIFLPLIVRGARGAAEGVSKLWHWSFRPRPKAAPIPTFERFQRTVRPEPLEKVEPSMTSTSSPSPVPSLRRIIPGLKREFPAQPQGIKTPQPMKAPAAAGWKRLAEAEKGYKLPTPDLLQAVEGVVATGPGEDLQKNIQILEETLKEFGIDAKVAHAEPGPTITTYELAPAPGVKVHRITALSDDIALVMKAPTVRIVAPIPGKNRVGVEVPNTQIGTVGLRSILETRGAMEAFASLKLPLVLGKDASGAPIVSDLAEMPHLLIAGTTGSGKTVCVNAIIMSLLFKKGPGGLRFLMIDPKMVELTAYNELPHLLSPVVTDAKKVSRALAWLVGEMENRYKLLARVGVRNIDLYNEKVEGLAGNGSESAEGSDAFEPLPYIVVIIDELADLMMVAQNEIEGAITRLAQLSRAVGIHMVLATQRPSVDVITGIIKANFPSRISFRVASRVDSRTVLDMSGADKLLGKGDMLFLKPGAQKPIRGQGTYLADVEIERIVSYIKGQRAVEYHEEVLQQTSGATFGKSHEKDGMFDEAARIVLESRQASVSYLQRRLSLGYTRAARLVDMMEEEGIVGPFRGAKPRDILYESWDDYARRRGVAAGEGKAS